MESSEGGVILIMTIVAWGVQENELPIWPSELPMLGCSLV